MTDTESLDVLQLRKRCLYRRLIDKCHSLSIELEKVFRPFLQFPVHSDPSVSHILELVQTGKDLLDTGGLGQPNENGKCNLSDNAGVR